MAVDILIMETDLVPVGKDQLQHVEYTADIAQAFNAVYGNSFRLKIPKAVVPTKDSGRALPGTDGRKMSKSYGNTIPLFAPEADLRKIVRRIPTDSTPVEAPKDPDSSPVFQLLAHFASSEKTAEVRARLEAGGMGWGQLKDELYAVLNEELGPLRARYDALMQPGSELDELLALGAVKARRRARSVLEQVRKAIGIGGPDGTSVSLGWLPPAGGL
jgi:tryptophanyl-tRNA synthetase